MRVPVVDFQPGQVERLDRLGDLQVALGLEVVVDVEVDAHVGPGTLAEGGERVVNSAQRGSVGVQFRMTGCAAEAGSETNEFLAVERQYVGLQRLEAAALDLGTEGGNIVVRA